MLNVTICTLGYLSDRWTSQGADEVALRLSKHNPDVYAYRSDWDDQPSYPKAEFTGKRMNRFLPQLEK